MLEPTPHQRPDPTPFRGFEPLTANYLYCPNQFFDVCLVNSSRGVVRIVSYLLRETLGWLDKQGNPRQQEITVSYSDLVRQVGVSRGAIAPALQEAVAAGFIERQQSGRAKSAGESGQSAIYRLRWSARGDYVRDLNSFDGFFAGEGHRTPIPNAFFDQIVSQEPLAVVKVVGTVLRHTIGYQNQFGGRRSAAPLAYTYIAKYAHLSLGRVLNQAVQAALEAGYIDCVVEGQFGAHAADRTPAQYGIRWLTNAENPTIGSKKPAANREPPERFKKTIDIGSETPSVDRFKKAIKEKTPSNNINKQQAAASEAVQLLTNAGLDRSIAIQLARQQGSEVIKRQLAWLDDRHPRQSRLGMLRKSIEEDWPAPQAAEVKTQRTRDRLRHRQRDDQVVAEDAQRDTLRRARQRRKQRLLEEWGTATLAERERWIREAAHRESSRMLADIIRRQQPDAHDPHLHVLETLAAERNLPQVTQSA